MLFLARLWQHYSCSSKTAPRPTPRRKRCWRRWPEKRKSATGPICWRTSQLHRIWNDNNIELCSQLIIGKGRQLFWNMFLFMEAHLFLLTSRRPRAWSILLCLQAFRTSTILTLIVGNAGRVLSAATAGWLWPNGICSNNTPLIKPVRGQRKISARGMGLYTLHPVSVYILRISWEIFGQVHSPIRENILDQYYGVLSGPI